MRFLGYAFGMTLMLNVIPSRSTARDLIVAIGGPSQARMRFLASTKLGMTCYFRDLIAKNDGPLQQRMRFLGFAFGMTLNFWVAGLNSLEAYSPKNEIPHNDLGYRNQASFNTIGTRNEGYSASVVSSLENHDGVSIPKSPDYHTKSSP
jgi:hypothetical protein